jgi:hypothetical protein
MLNIRASSCMPMRCCNGVRASKGRSAETSAGSLPVHCQAPAAAEGSRRIWKERPRPFVQETGCAAVPHAGARMLAMGLTKRASHLTRSATEALKLVGEYFPWAPRPGWQPERRVHPGGISDAAALPAGRCGTLEQAGTGGAGSSFVYLRANHKVCARDWRGEAVQITQVCSFLALPCTQPAQPGVLRFWPLIPRGLGVCRPGVTCFGVALSCERRRHIVV